MRIVFALRSRISSATRWNSGSCSIRRVRACGCSPISARNCAPASELRREGSAACSSADDTLAPVHEDSLDLELLGEDDHVCWESDLDPTGRRKSKDARWHLGRGTDCVRERCPESVQVPD